MGKQPSAGLVPLRSTLPIRAPDLVQLRSTLPIRALVLACIILPGQLLTSRRLTVCIVNQFAAVASDADYE